MKCEQKNLPVVKYKSEFWKSYRAKYFMVVKGYRCKQQDINNNEYYMFLIPEVIVGCSKCKKEYLFDIRLVEKQGEIISLPTDACICSNFIFKVFKRSIK